MAERSRLIGILPVTKYLWAWSPDQQQGFRYGPFGERIVGHGDSGIVRFDCFRLGLPHTSHRAGRLEKPNQPVIAVGRGYCRGSGNEWCGVQCSVRKNRSTVRERPRAACGRALSVEGGTSPLASKPFSKEVVVYERAAPSGGCSKLQVGISPSTCTGETERSALETRRKQLGY